MKRRYREVAYFHNKNVADLQIYPEHEQPRRYRRKKRYKPTSEVQRHLNDKNRERSVIRRANATFTEKDIRLDLTYKPGSNPESVKAAENEVRKYLRRLKTVAPKYNINQLQYIWVTEQGNQNGRIHHHIIISGGIPLDVLASKWGKGYTTVKPLQFDEFGITALVKYMLKNPVSSGKAKYHCSRNLNQPKKRTRAGRIPNRAVELMSTYTDFSVIEKLYPGYRIVDFSPFYNDVNGGLYFSVKLYKSN